MASLGQVEGIALAENLVIPVLWANSEKIPYAVHEVAVRDDDDNNLANETPHMAEIRAAAERHGLEWALQDDATPPTVQIVSPLPGALLAGVASLLVRAQDNVHVESVAVLIAGQVRGFGNPSSNQDPIEFNTCPIPGGPYTLKAVVYDWKDLAGSHEISVRIANGSNPPISDLSAMAPSPGSVELNWTSPATAANPMAYDVRYAPFPLTDANWDTDGVTPVLTGVPLPKSNTRQTMIVNAQIHESRNYFFAIKIINPCGIASSLSNVASINTPTLRTGLFVIASIPPPTGLLAGSLSLPDTNQSVRAASRLWPPTGSLEYAGQFRRAGRMDSRFRSRRFTSHSNLGYQPGYRANRSTGLLHRSFSRPLYPCSS